MINRVSIRLLESKKNLVGVEIGLNVGDNATNILENLDIVKLYLVDPYIPFANFTKAKVDMWRASMYKNFKTKYRQSNGIRN